jgi:hypothetical protein
MVPGPNKKVSSCQGKMVPEENGARPQKNGTIFYRRMISL